MESLLWWCQTPPRTSVPVLAPAALDPQPRSGPLSLSVVKQENIDGGLLNLGLAFDLVVPVGDLSAGPTGDGGP